MDRKRSRNNAVSNTLNIIDNNIDNNKITGIQTKGIAKKYYTIGFFLGITLLLSCTQSGKTISPTQNNKRQYHDHIPENSKVLTMQQRFAGILKSHNNVRSKHNLPPLKWSEKLANYSLEWANHLGRGNQCQMYHRGGKPPYGENLYISSAEVWRDQNGREVKRNISPVTITEVVNSWASEEKWYNYRQNHCQAGQQCGHYTQIVWKNTTEVGCAMKVCTDKSQTWVCSYNPPGNYIDERPY